MHTEIARTSVLEHPWRIAALVAVLANVAFNYLNERLGQGARSVAEVSGAYPSLFTPAGYAFAIWGVIYAASIVYAAGALMPSQHDVRMHDRLAPWLLGTNVLASLWIVLFTRELLGLSVVVIIAMLACCVVMYGRASQHAKHEGLSLWWRVPFGLWLGWLSVASIANVSSALVATGWDGSPLSPALWAAILLGAAGAVALAVNILFKDAVVPLVVSWAALAIAVARWDQSTLVAVVAAVVAIKTLIWAAATVLFQLVPPPPRYAQPPYQPQP